tara:strand:- start:12 stop:725 length:714 start_codon:yes stop_codon:yes gene_type:complete
MFNFSLFKKKIEIIADVKIVRTFNRKKTLTLRVKNNQAEILCPYYTSSKYLRNFIVKKKNWIRKNIENNSKNLSEIDQISKGYIRYKGKKLSLICEKAKHERVLLEEDKLKVFYSRESSERKKKIIIFWLKYESYKFLNERLFFLSKKININFNSLKIRSYRARWGSCNEKGDILLNWKLIMLPESVIDYVLIHELAHVLIPNHSEFFWKLVEKKYPTYKEKKKWLKENGRSLIAFG